jgi:hypothetical protein
MLPILALLNMGSRLPLSRIVHSSGNTSSAINHFDFLYFSYFVLFLFRFAFKICIIFIFISGGKECEGTPSKGPPYFFVMG